jgi:hypothetical protein
MSEIPNDYRPHCIHLTCKSMMVYGEDFRNDPEFQSGMVEFTCTCTFKGEGPDGQMATLEACSDPQRPCFREY